jgi:hypothetical protein
MMPVQKNTAALTRHEEKEHSHEDRSQAADVIQIKDR